MKYADMGGMGVSGLEPELLLFPLLPLLPLLLSRVQSPQSPSPVWTRFQASFDWTYWRITVERSRMLMPQLRVAVAG